MPRFISRTLDEDTIQFAYKNRKGRRVFLPLYKKYNEYFFEDIISNTKIVSVFKKLRDTSIFERFMLNAAQFSASKDAAVVKLLQGEIFTPDKETKPFSRFQKDAEKIIEIPNKVWLRVEREMCVRQCVQADRFMDLERDADLYPYWMWVGVMDDRERDEHVEMEGKVFRIGDPEGDACFPPGDWNCRCSDEPLDDNDIQERGLTVQTNAEAKGLLEKYIDPQFQYNPAAQGAMPNTGSYFDVLPSANAAGADTFDMPDVDSDEQLTGLGARFLGASGLHYIVSVVNEWKNKYDTTKSGDIIFRNKRLYTNVKFTDNALHAIQRHDRGFENIPVTIEQPDEVWSYWETPAKQRVVLRNYLKFGKTSYVVQTKDGVVQDAFAVSNRALNKFRKGVIL